MKEFKHTKGPWFINESEVCAELKEGIITIAEIARTGAGFTRKEEDANAKLIAAAPELLEACINALDTLKSLSGGINDSTQESLREAIKKATE